MTSYVTYIYLDDLDELILGFSLDIRSCKSEIRFLLWYLWSAPKLGLHLLRLLAENMGIDWRLACSLLSGLVTG